MLYFKLSSILMLDITSKYLQCFYFYTKIYISIILAQDLLVTTILVILGSIIIKTLFPSFKLKFGTASPKVIEDYQSTYSKRKFKYYYLLLYKFWTVMLTLALLFLKLKRDLTMTQSNYNIFLHFYHLFSSFDK